MSKPTLTYADFVELTESLDIDVGEVKRDPSLEMMAKMMLPDESHDSARVMYNKHMNDNNLRLIKFKNPEGQVEYHVHNNQMMPGFKSGNVSKLGFMSVAKIIHDDGMKELEAGHPLRFQSVEGSDQHAKYVAMIDRLASKAGRTVKHIGMKPITSAPFLQGETILVQ